MRSKVWYLKRFPLFDGMPEGEIKKLAKFLDERQVNKMQIIFDPEDQDKAFFIKKGLVEVYALTEDGKKVILETLGPGSFFAAVGSRGDQANFLEASEEAFICVTTKERLFQMISSEPNLARQVVEDLISQLLEAREQSSILATGSVREKLSYVLHRLARKYGRSRGARVKIEKRFTHEDLANMIGSSRETVTKMLSSLEEEGAVVRQGKFFEISSSFLHKQE